MIPERIIFVSRGITVSYHSGSCRPQWNDTVMTSMSDYTRTVTYGQICLWTTWEITGINRFCCLVNTRAQIALWTSRDLVRFSLKHRQGSHTSQHQIKIPCHWYLSLQPIERSRWRVCSKSWNRRWEPSSLQWCHDHTVSQRLHALLSSKTTRRASPVPATSGKAAPTKTNPHIFRVLRPCIVSKVWREKTNKMQQLDVYY